MCVCVCVQLSYSPHHWTDHDQTRHDDGPPPKDGAHHFSRSKVKVIAYVYILSYSPHHWTDHDQTWHDDGPPPRDGAHHFSRSRSKVKVMAMYIYSPTAHTTGPVMTKPGMMMVPHLWMVHTIFQGKGQRSRS